MVCLSTASFSINVNGDSFGFFKAKRGLRQGNPVSPYLFTIIMEVFNLMDKRQISGSLVEGSQCQRNDVLMVVCSCGTFEYGLFHWWFKGSGRVGCWKWTVGTIICDMVQGPRNQNSRNGNQDSSRRTVNVEEENFFLNSIWCLLMEMVLTGAIWQMMKSLQTWLLWLFQTLRIEFNKSEFNLATYKRGLTSVEEQLVFYRKNEFQHSEFEGYGPKTSKNVSEDTSNEVRESPDALMVEKLVLDDKLEKKAVFPTVAKIEFVRPKQQE
ncbi:ribonuclease H-like domain-containing protein [Tanacetum coccineum]